MSLNTHTDTTSPAHSAENLLVIILDQMRADALASPPGELVSVPNMRGLADSGGRFTNAFTAAPVCNPARQSLMTGLYPHQHGVVTNRSNHSRELRTIAHQAAAAGIETVNIGSNGWRGTGTDGFQLSRGSKQEWMDSLSETTKAVLEAENSRHARRTTGGPSPRRPEEYRTIFEAGLAAEELERLAGDGKRFLMWCNLHEPHPPFRPPRDLYEKRIHKAWDHIPRNRTDIPSPFMRELARDWAHLTDHEWAQLIAAYYGLLELADQGVGRILDTLRTTGLEENTAVILVADHGEMAGEHGTMLKFNFREAAVRIPLVVSAPGMEPFVSDRLASGVDVYASAAEILRLPIQTGHAERSPVAGGGATRENDDTSPGKSNIPGRSLLSPSPEVREEVFAQYGEHDMVRTDQWKLVRYHGRAAELFRVDSDPGEAFNLIDRVGEAEVRALEQRLERMRVAYR